MRSIILALVLSSSAANGTGEAFVANLEGVPTLTRSSATRALREGDSLRVGDRIVLGEDASVEIVLGDGSVIEAGERTRLVIRTLAASSGILRFAAHLEAGFLSNTVIPAQGIEYRVTTPTGTAGVRGTQFDVAFDESQDGTEDGTDLSVEEGLVEVESESGEKSEVRAGAAGRFSRARFERREDVRARLASRREAVRSRIRSALERRFRSALQSGRTPTEGEIYREIPERVRQRMSPETRNRFRENLRDRIQEIRERNQERREERRSRFQQRPRHRR